MMCERTQSRSSFGKVYARHQMVQEYIADSRIELETAKLLTLRAAWKFDREGNRGARSDIAMCKVYNAQVLHNVVDRSLQVHGSLGYSGDLPLESMYRMARMASLVDGANEVHKVTSPSPSWRGTRRSRAGPVEHVPTRLAPPARGSPTCWRPAREPHRGDVRRRRASSLAGAGDRRARRGDRDADPRRRLLRDVPRRPAGRSWILRRAPLAAVSDTAHQVIREARIIEALAGSGVPVPTVLAIGEDPSVLGAPFFVMSRVDGDVVRRTGLPDDLVAHPESHRDRRGLDRHPGRAARLRLAGDPWPSCRARRASCRARSTGGCRSSRPTVPATWPASTTSRPGWRPTCRPVVT